MRVTIVFLLVVCILVLTVWAWRLTPQRLEYLPLLSSDTTRSEEINKINSYTDIELLRAHAMRLIFNPDEKAYERDLLTLKASNILGLITLLTMVSMIILFLEIAARGKAYRQRDL